MRDVDGAVPCYSGFHPHLTRPHNLYASCKVDENENLIEIHENSHGIMTKPKRAIRPEFITFKNGAILKKYCQKNDRGCYHINGEYYASLPFNYLLKDGLKVWCPVNIDYFCQWGTPEDLEEYLFWINMVEGLQNDYSNSYGRQGHALFTMRAIDSTSHAFPRLTAITGEKLPMIICAMKDMPNIDDKNNQIICVNRDFHAQDGTENIIHNFFSANRFYS